MGDNRRPNKYSQEPREQTNGAWWRESIALANRLQISYWVIRFFQVLAKILPVRCSYGISTGLAYLTYLIWPGMRRTATKNMHRVLGPDVDSRTVSRTVRSAYRNYFKYLTEFLRFPALPGRELQRLAVSTGWENVDRALDAGKGAIIVCFHIGNWDMAGTLIALNGYPLNVVVDSFEPKRLNDKIQALRVAQGVKIIPIEAAGRRVIHALRKNEVLGLLIDLPTPLSKGVLVKLFGGTCCIPAGAATLALKTGARVLPGYAVRKPDNTFEGYIGSAVEFEPSGDFESDVQRFSQAMVDRLSEYVRRYPDQWFLFRDLWIKEEAVPEVAWAT